MTPIDSLLNILVQQEGTELKLASGRSPKMFKGDVELPLTIPAISTEQIRELLGELWTAHGSRLAEGGELSLPYQADDIGSFTVGLVRPDASSLEVCFRRAEAQDGGSSGRRARPNGAAKVTFEPARPLPPAFIELLHRAVTQNASDIHLSPHRKPILRINTTLHLLDDETGFDVAALLADSGDPSRLEAGISVDRAIEVPGLARLRVNIYSSEEGLCAAVRILRKDVPSLAELNLPSQLASLTDLPHGLILVCGPTGSGKSTTLASLVQHALHVEPQVLVTLEDPIEYVIRPMRPSGLVRQREVGRHVRDFATGLRDALREDPDILLIGEMRDPETISLALTAAETGHLVFASLHTRTAPSAVERIVDTYPPERQRQIRVQLADALRAVISQRLIPTADGASRVPAIELLRVTHGVANLIREGRTAQIVSALQAGGNEGMQVLERNLVDLVRTKRIRREAAVAAANDVSALNEYLRAAGC
jgi:twitching motility protein PilT